MISQLPPIEDNISDVNRAVNRLFFSKHKKFQAVWMQNTSLPEGLFFRKTVYLSVNM